MVFNGGGAQMWGFTACMVRAPAPTWVHLLPLHSNWPPHTAPALQVVKGTDTPLGTAMAVNSLTLEDGVEAVLQQQTQLQMAEVRLAFVGGQLCRQALALALAAGDQPRHEHEEEALQGSAGRRSHIPRSGLIRCSVCQWRRSPATTPSACAARRVSADRAGAAWLRSVPVRRVHLGCHALLP